MSGATCWTMTNNVDTPRAIVAAHGDLAAGLVSAVQQITGLGACLLAQSNSGLDLVALERAMRDAVRGHGATVIFTDLPAGSCVFAARKATRDLPGVAVVTGVNLTTLLEFVLKGGADRAALEHAAARGREALAVAPVLVAAGASGGVTASASEPAPEPRA